MGNKIKKLDVSLSKNLFAALKKSNPDLSVKEDEILSSPYFRSSDVLLESLKTQIAIEIDREMKLKNISQNALSKQLGITRQSINEILAMNGNVTLKTLTKIASALSCRISLHIRSENSDMQTIENQFQERLDTFDFFSQHFSKMEAIQIVSLIPDSDDINYDFSKEEESWPQIA